MDKITTTTAKPDSADGGKLSQIINFLSDPTLMKIFYFALPTLATSGILYLFR